MTTTEQIRGLLHGADLSRVRMHHICDHLEMSQSALANTLSRDGFTYTQILRNERRERCAALLGRNPHVDSAGIQRVTGYSPASVTRWVRKWFGFTLKSRGLAG